MLSFKLFCESLADQAKEFFGVTRDPRECGYILPDGTMLDLSGRHYSVGYRKTPQGYRPEPGQPDYHRGQRHVDHREVSDLIGDGGTESMWEFQKQTGAVRYMHDNGIFILGAVTPQQAQVVVSCFSKATGKVMYVDLDDPVTGETESAQVILPLTVTKLQQAVQDLLGPADVSK